MVDCEEEVLLSFVKEMVEMNAGEGMMEDKNTNDETHDHRSSKHNP